VSGQPIFFFRLFLIAITIHFYYNVPVFNRLLNELCRACT